jgi:putative transposase
MVSEMVSEISPTPIGWLCNGLMIDRRWIGCTLRPTPDRWRSMPRPPRCKVADVTQHVVQRGNNRTNIFRSESDYLFFRYSVRKAIHRFPCLIHAYVWMPNHFHFLMTPVVDGAVGKVMQSIGSRYVRYFNRRYERTGTLWEGRHFTSVITSEHYMLGCYRYIETNPVEAGFTTELGEYRWSSYAANALGHPDDLITPHSVYQALASEPTRRLRAYRELFQIGIDQDTRDAILSR